MKIVWYLNVEHIPTFEGNVDGPSVFWAHGKGGRAIPEEDVTEEWLKENSFKTEAAAIRSAHKASAKYKDKLWDVGNVSVVPATIPDEKLHYRIYRCYEIVIEDSEGNQVGHSDYCYGTRKDAEIAAKHHLKMTKMEEGIE